MVARTCPGGGGRRWSCQGSPGVTSCGDAGHPPTACNQPEGSQSAVLTPTLCRSERRSPRSLERSHCAGAILLASGAGSALAAPSCAPSGANTVCTFSTPGADTFTVPNGVTEASFDSFGAQGGGVTDFTTGGLGGRASAELALTPGATVSGGRGWQGR